MICFFDASAMLKSYLDEQETPYIKQVVQESHIIVSTHSFIEIGASLGRAAKHGRISETQFQDLFNKFETAWEHFAIIQYDENMISNARILFTQYSLRAGDIVQLASAIAAQNLLNESIDFVTFDKQLWRAAGEQGFNVLPENLITS